MKLVIETVDHGKAKLTLNFQGKDYSETWIRNESGFETIGESLICKMENDGVAAINTDIEEFIDSIDVPCYIDLAESEEDW